MHPDHAGGKGVTAGEPAAAHDGDRHRGVHLFGELPELPVGPAPDHAAAAEQERPLRRRDHLQQGIHILVIRLRLFQPVAAEGPDATAAPVFRPGDELVIHHLIGGGDVFQDVNQHRAGPSRGGHGEGLPHHVGDGAGVPDQEGGLRNRHGNAGDIHLLEGVLPQKAFAHVAGDEHHRGGVQIGGGDAGGEVGGPGAGGGEAHAHLPSSPGVAVRRVGGPLLVGRQDMAEPVPVAVEFVVQVQDSAARIAEDGVHLLLQQTFHNCRGRSDFHSVASFQLMAAAFRRARYFISRFSRPPAAP